MGNYLKYCILRLSYSCPERLWDAMVKSGCLSVFLTKRALNTRFCEGIIFHVQAAWIARRREDHDWFDHLSRHRGSKSLVPTLPGKITRYPFIEYLPEHVRSCEIAGTPFHHQHILFFSPPGSKSGCRTLIFFRLIFGKPSSHVGHVNPYNHTNRKASRGSAVIDEPSTACLAFCGETYIYRSITYSYRPIKWIYMVELLYAVMCSTVGRLPRRSSSRSILRKLCFFFAYCAPNV